jgi:hypothetical protein
MAKLDLAVFEQERVDTAEKEDCKLRLFLQQREVGEIGQILETVKAKPATERMKFVQQNQAYLEPLGQELRDRMALAAEEMMIDKETMNLTMNLADQVRDTYNLWQELMVS